MSSAGRSSQIKPHPPWTSWTRTMAAIAMPASAGAARPDDGCGLPAVGVAAGAGAAGRAAGRSATSSPSSPQVRAVSGRPVRSPNSPDRQPARLEVLAEVRHDRVTVGIGGPHRSGTIIPGHGVHWFPALPGAAVSGFRVSLYCRRQRTHGTIAR